MKLGYIVLVSALVLTACGTTNTKKADTVDAPEVSAIGSQKLSSSFTRRGIKIDYDCAWGTGAFGLTDAMCSRTTLRSIEVTAYAPSFGNSEAIRENAFRVAEDQAKAKLVRFLREDVKSSSVTKTIGKNIEKANDRIKQRITSTEEVSMSDDEASKDTNYAVRDNTNETAREFVETVQNQAQGILKGVYIKDERIVDRQTVEVTIRWDKDSHNSATYIRGQMGK